MPSTLAQSQAEGAAIAAPRLDRVSIVYLIGSGRSGTTLLSRLLELQDGFFAVGEPRYIGQQDTWSLRCGCGKAHANCTVWSPLIAEWSDPQRLRDWEGANRAGQREQLAGFLRPGKPLPAVQRGLAELKRVYTTLAAGGQVVVDESKTPWLGYLLAQQPWADVRFVELVRHPGSVLKSRVVEKDYQPPTPREVAAKHWLRTCITADVVRKRTRSPWLRTSFVRFLNQPQEVLAEILGHPPQGMDGAAFEAPDNHIYLSNADKLRRGPDSVRPSSGQPPEPFPHAGRWERMSERYWSRWLGERIELRRNWSPVPAPSQRS